MLAEPVWIVTGWEIAVATMFYDQRDFGVSVLDHGWKEPGVDRLLFVGPE